MSAEAALTGTDFQSLENDLQRFQLGLAGAQNSTNRVAQGLRVLGLNAREFSGLSVDQQVLKLADAFSGFADGPTKTAAAMALLGRSGAEMLPFLDRGREGFEELTAEVQRLGASLSNDQAAAFMQVEENFHRVQAAAQGLSISMFSALAPSINGAINAFVDFRGDLDQASAHSQASRAEMQLLADAGKTVATGFIGLGSIFTSTLSLVELAVREVVDAVGTAGAVIRDAWQRNWTEIPVDAKAGLSSMKTDLEQFASDQKAIVENGFKSVETMWTTTPESAAMATATQRLRTEMGAVPETATRAATALKSVGDAAGGAALNAQKMRELFTGLPAVPQMQIGGNKDADQALEAQLTSLNQEVDAYKSAYTLQDGLIQEQVKTKQLSAQQGLQAVLDALQDEQQDVGEVYSREEALAQGNQQKLREIQLQAAKFQEENAKAVQDAQIKSAEQTVQQWRQAFNEINSAFDSQISGLIRGTTTWSQAFKNVITQLTVDLAKFFINWGLQATETELMQLAGIGRVTTAQEASDVAKGASQAASAASATTSALAGVLTQLKADAAAVYGGVFAFLAPFMGPAAVGPATASAGSVAAAGIGSFDIGSWSVPMDQLAMVHQGEMIVPAAQTPWMQSLASSAGKTRAGMTGGGDTNHNALHVHLPNVKNSNDFMSDFRANRGEVAKQLSRHMASSRWRPKAT
ncbi:hypothetical protein CWB41_14025 [Methylovirgula ligni]|nr:hypothetical protein CWB41_14025 [Methylovirgula ligni]